MQFIDETITTRNPIFGFLVSMYQPQNFVEGKLNKVFPKILVPIELKILKSHQVLQKRAQTLLSGGFKLQTCGTPSFLSLNFKFRTRYLNHFLIELGD